MSRLLLGPIQLLLLALSARAQRLEFEVTDSFCQVKKACGITCTSCLISTVLIHRGSFRFCIILIIKLN